VILVKVTLSSDSDYCWLWLAACICSRVRISIKKSSYRRWMHCGKVCSVICLVYFQQALAASYPSRIQHLPETPVIKIQAVLIRTFSQVLLQASFAESASELEISSLISF